MSIVDEQAIDTEIGNASEQKRIGLEEYYSEAGPDYAAWSPNYNMHFGFYRFGMNPLRREPMLEQMNREVLDRLRVDAAQPVRLLDLGCGLGATMRSFARALPNADLTGITLVPWQVERARELNGECAACTTAHVVLGDYERFSLPPSSFDAAYALESSCHAAGANKSALLQEARRLLRPGGRLVVADGFLRRASDLRGPQQAIYRKLCECWVIETLGELDLFTAELQRLALRTSGSRTCRRVSPPRSLIFRGSRSNSCSRM